MTRTKTFEEIRKKMDEITKRPPTKEQLEDLRNTFLEIAHAETEAVSEKKVKQIEADGFKKFSPRWTSNEQK